MKTRSRRPTPAAIVEAVVKSLVSEKANLKSVTLDEFKERLKQTIRSMADELKATAV